MTATAVSLTMVSLRSEGLGKSPVAMRIMTSAVLDDIASLAFLAIAVPLVTESQSLGKTVQRFRKLRSHFCNGLGRLELQRLRLPISQAVFER